MILPKYWSPTKKLMVLGAMAGGKAVEDTVTGNPVAFLTDLAKPLKSLVANFLPIQASGTPSPDNILPITGWTGCNVYRTGKNLLHVNEQSMIFKSIARIEITYTETGCVIDVPQSQYSSFVLFEIMPITADMVGMQFIYSSTNVFNEDRIISCDIEGGNRTTIPNGIVRQIDVGKILALRIYPTGEGTYTISEMQMEIGTSSTAYSPYTGETIPVSFPSTIFGGYVDLVTGELWGTYGIVDLSSKTWTAERNGDSKFFLSSEVADAVLITNTETIANIYCPIFKTVKASEIYLDTSGENAIGQVRKKFRVKANSYNEDADAFRTAMNGINLVYELAEPVLIATLSPQQINAIKGNNTVWSDANGNLEVTYMKKG